MQSRMTIQSRLASLAAVQQQVVPKARLLTVSLAADVEKAQPTAPEAKRPP